MKTTSRIVLSAFAVLAAGSSAFADLIGSDMDVIITHTGVAGGIVGAQGGDHDYGTADLFTNQFFGSWVLASPAVAPAFDNSLLVDFTLFNYSGFAGETATASITGIEEGVDLASVQVLVNGINVGTNVTNLSTGFSVKWAASTVIGGNPTAPKLTIAWDSVAVPAPGALALLGAAGVVGARRRRR